MSSSERGRVNASFRQQVWSLGPISSGLARIKNPGLMDIMNFINIKNKSEFDKLGFVLGGDVLRIMHGNMDHCITTPPPQPESQLVDDSGR